MRTIPYEDLPRGVGVLVLEAGDKIEVHQGEVYVIVYESDMPHYTLTTREVVD